MKKHYIAVAVSLIIVTVLVGGMRTALGASRELVLHSFSDTPDGSYPLSGLIFDSTGNLYGTTSQGGANRSGTVFALTPNGGGGWSENVLYDFTGGFDGSNPYSSLVLDATGNLYGTTQYGGMNSGGTVFELTPNVGGGWTETAIHSFGGGNDGLLPYASLIFDAAGNLYGTTTNGGTHNAGVVFQLAPGAGGQWTESVLHSFGGNGDGAFPFSNLTLDGAGNLYGTTFSGGISPGFGTVFRLSPGAGGQWTENVIHRFTNGRDGGGPFAGLVFDSAGNLYGATNGENAECGNVFQLSPVAGNKWKETVVHRFPGAIGGGPDGCEPDSSLTIDGAGNLYGNTNVGGNQTNGGLVYKLAPKSGGGWTETVLYRFHRGNDGGNPYLGVPVLDAAGNVYGTTVNGGTHNVGVVFEIAP